jgi:hypothetical protein
MKNLNITIHDDHYSANNIEHGRLAKAFISDLSRNIFLKSYLYWEKYQEIGASEMPLLHSEKNIYSIISSSIDKITPLHAAEWPFSAPDGFDKSKRIVDFWCANKEGEGYGKLINYFIEIKKFDYCVSEGTKEEITKHASSIVDDIINQISNLKKIKPKWAGDGNVYVGIIIVPGYHSSSRDPKFGPESVISSIYDKIHKGSGAQLIASTWNIPEYMEIQWEDHTCQFVTIAAIVVSTKK